MFRHWSWGQSYFSYVSSLKPGLANKIILVQREKHVLQVVLYDGFGNIYKVLTYLRTWWLLCDHKLWQRIRRLWQRQTMPASSQVNREHWGWKIYIYENHDIAIAMSSSSQADTDSVLAWGKGLIQCHCTGWSHLNLYIIRVIALSRCKMFKSDNQWEGWCEMVLLTHTQTDTAFYS